MNSSWNGLLFAGLGLFIFGCTSSSSPDDDDGASTSTTSEVAETSTGSAESTTTSTGQTVDGSSSGDSGGESQGDAGSSSSGGVEIMCDECSARAQPDPLCHSTFNPATGDCECDRGYIFENTDPNDFTCVLDEKTGDCGDDPNAMINEEGGCECVRGYDWCSPDPDDLTCCRTSKLR